jgi:inward rectifier potassium channel
MRPDVPRDARAIPQNGYTIYLVGEGSKQHLRDAYHTFLRVSWWASLGLIALAFIAINLVFAVVYYAVGGVDKMTTFFDAMSFSVQTLSTVGYGVMNPTSSAANTVMMIESVVSIIVTALATGLVFAKFSRATARVAFSTTAVVTPHDGRQTLMFRIGNRRGNTIYDAQVRVVASMHVTTLEGESFYRMYDLPLVRDRQIGLKRGWTVMHVIDERSPLHGLDADALAKREVEIQVSLQGIDDTSMQGVTVIHEYSDTEIRFGVRFADTLKPLSNGDLLFDQGNFDRIVPHDSVRA